MQHKMAADDIIKYKIPQRRNKVHGCGILYIDNKAIFRTATDAAAALGAGGNASVAEGCGACAAA